MLKHLYSLKSYKEELEYTAAAVEWDLLYNKSILITGANGMIGSFTADLFAYANETRNTNITIFLLDRNEQLLTERFGSLLKNHLVKTICQDIAVPLSLAQPVDYIINGASSADPLSFSKDPVGVMKANFIGSYNILEWARLSGVQRVLYISSGEVYGQGAQDVKQFEEGYSGYVDISAARSCYPQSKRAAETLHASYYAQYQVNSVVVRPCHVYGPTMTVSDSRAASQFIRKAVEGHSIILKSAGSQVRSYCYVGDAVLAILTVLLNGKINEAYNISNPSVQISIREFAQSAAQIGETNVIFESPVDIEKAGYSTVDQSVLAAHKLCALGWSAMRSFYEGLRKTIEILKEQVNESRTS